MSESVSSSYLNFRHQITTRYINQLRQDKEEKEKKELQTRSYLSKYSQELIQKMFNKNLLSKTEHKLPKSSRTVCTFSHEAIRQKAKKRVYDNFIRGFCISKSVQLDIKEARKNNNKERIEKSKNEYKEIFPYTKRIGKFYDAAMNKKDTFRKSKSKDKKKKSKSKKKVVFMNSYAETYKNRKTNSITEERKKDIEIFKQSYSQRKEVS